MAREADVVIIGAGAAGLACARALLAHGLEPVVLEARDRIGGRVLTLSADAVAPMELGAEFLHGADPATLAELDRRHMPYAPVADTHFLQMETGLRESPGYWTRIQDLGRRLSTRRAWDCDLEEFLYEHPLFRDYVEGFYAADPALIGEKGLARALREEEPAQGGASLFRPLQGYGPLLWEMAAELGDRLRLATPVKRVEWSPGKVKVRAGGVWRARAVVVTVPLGVLKSGGLELRPFPRRLGKALRRLHMGHVQRLVFTFRAPFWNEFSERPIGFLHGAPGGFFTTWWTQWPHHAPRLVAWQGGPAAEEMAGWPMAKRVEVALEALADITGLAKSFLREELVRVDGHDWSNDPWARGAYGYLGVGGVAAAKRLACPFGDTLFLAGEMTAPGRSQGTVHGALASGRRAAEQVARRLRRQRHMGRVPLSFPTGHNGKHEKTVGLTGHGQHPLPAHPAYPG